MHARKLSTHYTLTSSYALFNQKVDFDLNGRIFANNFNSKKARARNLLWSKTYTPVAAPMKKNINRNRKTRLLLIINKRKTTKHMKQKRPKLVLWCFSWKYNIDCRNYICFYVYVYQWTSINVSNNLMCVVCRHLMYYFLIYWIWNMKPDANLLILFYFSSVSCFSLNFKSITRYVFQQKYIWQ